MVSKVPRQALLQTIVGNTWEYVSGEWVLRDRSNSGLLVFIRSLLVSTAVYVLAMSLNSWLRPGAKWVFDSEQLAVEIRDTIPWAGAIFAGAYAAFYTRFSAQWSYLADLYNQIMSTQVQCVPLKPEGARKLAYWKAGFIEDAEDMHLALRPIFAAVIHGMLQEQEIRDAYLANTHDAAKRLIELEVKLDRILK